MDTNSVVSDQTPNDNIQTVPPSSSNIPKLPSKISWKAFLPVLALALALPFVANSIRQRQLIGSSASYPNSYPCNNSGICPTPTPSNCGNSYPCPTTTTAPAISCKVEVYRATATTTSPYTYPSTSLVDQNSIRINPGENYQYGLRVFNLTPGTLGNLQIKVRQLRGGLEPIKILSNDSTCLVNATDKSLNCNIANAIGTGTSALTSSAFVAQILAPLPNEPKTSTLYEVISAKGTVTCASSMFFAAQPIPTTVNRLPVITTTSLATAVVGAGYQGQVEATDQDVSDVLTMDFAGLPSGFSKGPCASSPGSGLLRCIIQGIAPSSGVYSIGVTVKDNKGGTAQKTLTLNAVAATPVTPTPIRPNITSTPTPAPVVNSAPKIVTSSLFPRALFTGQQFNLAIVGEDKNLNDTLSMSAQNVPAGLSFGSCLRSTNRSINRITCTLSGRLIRSGIFNTVVTLSDGKGGSERKTFMFLVIGPTRSSGSSTVPIVSPR